MDLFDVHGATTQETQFRVVAFTERCDAKTFLQDNDEVPHARCSDGINQHVLGISLDALLHAKELLIRRPVAIFRQRSEPL